MDPHEPHTMHDVPANEPPRPVHTKKHPTAHARKKRQLFQLYLSVWYSLGIIESLLALRFLFKMLGANPVGFIDFLYGVTDPFATPFYGIFINASNGKYLIEWTTLVAMAIYALIAFGIVQFIRILTATNPDDVEDIG